MHLPLACRNQKRHQQMAEKSPHQSSILERANGWITVIANQSLMVGKITPCR